MAEAQNKNVKKRMTQRRRRRRRSVAVLLFALLLVAVILLVVFLFFRIGEIKVENSVSSVYTGTEITVASELEIGQNIFSFKKVDVEAALLQKLPYLGKVTVERRLPNTVVIKVSETTDYAAVPYRGGYLIVSSDIKILSDSYTLPEGIPVVYGIVPAGFTPGTALTAADESAPENLREILDQLLAYGWFDRVTAISVRDRLNLSMILDDRVFVEFGTVNKLEYKFEMLYEVVEKQHDETFEGRVDLSTPSRARVSYNGMNIPKGYFDIGEDA